MRTRGPLLVLGSGDEAYRDYALESLTSATRVLLVLAEAPTWQSRYPCDVLVADPTQPAAVLSALRQAEVRLAGVTTYNEFCVPAAAAVGEVFGLRYADPATARRCRDKFEMRRAFAAAGVPSARFGLAHSSRQALAIANRLGYPVVVKPRAMAGSIGVVRCDGPHELSRRVDQLLRSTDRQFGTISGPLLVEEMLVGDEVSVEAVVDRGRVTVVAVTRKRLSEPPFFEERGHVVSPAEPVPDEDRVRQVAVRAHAALGIPYGVTHTELRLTPAGPRLVELAARAGGDLIPLLVRLSTDIDLSAISAQVAIGESWSSEPQVRGAAGVRFFYPTRDLRLETVELQPRGLITSERDLYRVAWEAQPGDELRLPPRGYLSRLGYAIALGRTGRECEQQLDAAEARLRVCGEPVPV